MESVFALFIEMLCPFLIVVKYTLRVLSGIEPIIESGKT